MNLHRFGSQQSLSLVLHCRMSFCSKNQSRVLFQKSSWPDSFQFGWKKLRMDGRACPVGNVLLFFWGNAELDEVRFPRRAVFRRDVLSSGLILY